MRFYDPGLNLDRSPRIAAAIAQHKHAEMLSIARSVITGLDLLGDRNNVSLGARHTEDGQSLLDRSYWLHMYAHGLGNFIGAAICDKLQQMNQTMRKQALSMLYPSCEQCEDTGVKSNLETVLAAYGSTSQPELIRLFEEGADLALVPSR